MVRVAETAEYCQGFIGYALYPLDRYVWGVHYIDAPIVRYHDADTNGNLYNHQDDNLLYYLHDANFNVTGLVGWEDGAVLERYMYEPYGKVTVLNGQADADGAVDDWSPAAGELGASALSAVHSPA